MLQCPGAKQSFSIHLNTTSIESDAFSGCSHLTSINIPRGVTTIGNEAFKDCMNLTSITIPQNVTDLGVHAFDGCLVLQEIIVDDNNSFYSTVDGVLYSKDKTELLLCPSGKQSHSIYLNTTSIGDFAFIDCYNLTSITIPEGVTSIGIGAFAGCESLTSIILPKSIKFIETDAFLDCINLVSVTCKASTPPSCEPDIFDYVGRSLEIYVPESSVQEYQKAKPWEKNKITPIPTLPDSKDH